MATITAYLDTRTTNARGQHPLKIVFRVNKSTAMQSTGYWLEQNKWDNIQQRVKGKGGEAINNYIESIIYEMTAISKTINFFWGGWRKKGYVE